jgi:hypothetical protein
MIHSRKDYSRIQDSENKIPEDEPVWLLRAQDEAAYHVLRFWAALTKAAGGSQEIVDMAIAHAERMKAWPKKKTADLPKCQRQQLAELIETYGRQEEGSAGRSRCLGAKNE